MRRLRIAAYVSLTLVFGAVLLAVQQHDVVRIEAASYEACLERTAIVGAMNDTYGGALKKFVLSTAKGRREASQDQTSAPSARKRNRGTAREYERLASTLTPVTIPRCARP